MAVAFVTGGTGFVGHRLIERLVKQGWTVRALHRAPADADRLRALGAEPIKGDLGDPSALRRGLAGIDTVFHAAALFTMWAPYADFDRANVQGTRNLLSASQAEQVRCFIQIGASGAVMGDRKPMVDITEDMPLAFPSWAPYLASKARAQELVLGADKVGGMRTIVILPPLIWGPRMPMLDGVVADVEAGRFAWPGGGKAAVSTAHVDNVCECTLLAAAHSTGGRAYFVTDGENRTVRTVITPLIESRGIEVKARSIPLPVAWFMATVMETVWRAFKRPGQPPLTRQMLRMLSNDFTLSDRRAREELGYKPVIRWNEGITAMREASHPGSTHAQRREAAA